MLVGGDLGFISSLVVAAFVAVITPVLGFVVRRKWRRSVARREEIRRLLFFASEETARAEQLAAHEYGPGSSSGSGYGYSTYGYNSYSVVDGEKPASATVAGYSTYGYNSYSVEDDEKPASATVTVLSSSNSRQLQHECAVCSSPTSTRCSRCKAVRYCSGKCQILHWRQGHKDECRPISNSAHRNEVEVISHLKAYKQEPNVHLQGIDVEGRHSFESGDASPEEAAFLRSNDSVPSTGPSPGNGNKDRQCLPGAKIPNLNSSFVAHSSPSEHVDFTSSSEASVDLSASDSSDFDGSDSPHCAVGDAVKIQSNQSKVDGSKLTHTELPKIVCPVDIVSPPRKHNYAKPHIHGDAQSEYSTSTYLSADGSSVSSSTEPSTPSSGFWDGEVPYTRSRSDSLDNTASRHASDIKVSDSLSTSRQSPEMDRPINSKVSGQSNSKRNLENPNPVTVEVRKLANQAESRFEVKDETKRRRSSASRYVTPNQLEVHDCSDKCILTSEDTRFSSSSAPVNLKNDDELKFSSLTSSTSNKSYCGIESSTGVLQMPKDRPKESSHAKTSASHVSSTNGRHEVQTLKSAEIDCTQVASACSAEPSVPSPNSRNGLKSSVLKVVDQFRGSKLTRHKSLGDECEVMGRYGNKGVFPYENFVKLYNAKIELRPFGLVNCGNSCYANAVLQCLAFTPPLTSYLLQGLHSKTCEKKVWCFTCEFESLVLKANNGNSPLSPIRIISHLESIGSNLGSGREEDAHEFLRYVIDTMQSICLKEAGTTASGSFEEETTLVGLTFGGYLRSKIECMRCGGKSERQERMMDLTVEIDGDIGTLEEALKQFTHTETLDGENKYRCGRCKSYEKAKKKLKVAEAPNILTIALKRFQSGKFGKLNKTIKFPEYLNMAPYMSGTSDKSPVYQLYGVVVHLDVMNSAFSGHYVCYVRNSQKWFAVDDSSVKSVELERVLSKGAYMLLYSRCSPRSPKIMRSLTIPRDPRRSKQFPVRSSTRRHWDDSHGDATVLTSNECAYPSRASVRPSRSIFEDDSSSEQSSTLFSENGSCSTESTNRDSTSADDFFSFGECGGNSLWRSSSDSDTSSSSSSPSPLYSRRSPLADLDRYASGQSETSYSDGAETSGNNGFAGIPESNNSSKHCRNLVSSHSSSNIDASRLCRVNSSNDLKSPVSGRNR